MKNGMQVPEPREKTLETKRKRPWNRNYCILLIGFIPIQSVRSNFLVNAVPKLAARNIRFSIWNDTLMDMFAIMNGFSKT